MNTESNLSKQQLKSNATKDRIFRAAETILKKKGYEALSIKNICELAGVSNGSFYHHFQTKDDLLSYYIEHLPTVNPTMFEVPGSLENIIHTIIEVYLNYAEYCKELGVEFLSNYYVPHNEALNPTLRTQRTYPIVTVQHYLEKAIENNVVTTDLSIAEITTDIRMLVIGNVFEWCIHKGNTDFSENIRRSIGHYLQSTLSTPAIQ